jgi:hypothetical protein
MLAFALSLLVLAVQSMAKGSMRVPELAKGEMGMPRVVRFMWAGYTRERQSRLTAPPQCDNFHT